MRLRNNPKAYEIISQYNDIVIMRPQEYKGQWKQYFYKQCGNPPDSLLKVEIGVGRGKFITDSALINRSTDFVGIDLRPEIILSALRKVLSNELKNVLLIPFNAENIEDAFEYGEVDAFFLNFSDPWPKVRHAKRRLTHRLFLEKYKKLLKKNGEIIFKTDNRNLFDFSINEFRETGFDIVDLTNDLNNIDYPDNISTEYEEKFIKQGIKINRLKAVKV